jgi:hypothetical protein
MNYLVAGVSVVFLLVLVVVALVFWARDMRVRRDAKETLEKGFEMFSGALFSLEEERSKRRVPRARSIVIYGPDGMAERHELKPGENKCLRVTAQRGGPGRVLWQCDGCFVQSVLYGTDLIGVEVVGVSATVETKPGIQFGLNVVTADR